ncbi:hypothetical protein RBA41_25115 [Massilia sp. CCM 9210]|uniref:hypothetical protein n=1 Tax=Massilia scottii TaxID=3057166 RepID=UPI002796D6C1|nr:hypothetical protein [Massilia sp. CCM 9210]MDQ1816585.1 hypothetical protein [Massilia sp. CCM 9210]
MVGERLLFFGQQIREACLRYESPGEKRFQQAWGKLRVRKMKNLFSLILGGCVLSGCLQSREWRGDIRGAREFYRQPITQQQKLFRQHPLQDQLDLFFFGNQVRHPPALYLAQCFALNGAPAVELLRSKLKEDSGDLTVRDITMLLSTIDAMGKYDAAADAQLMALLKQRIAKMHDDGWRDTAERKMTGIGHERNELASQAPECS